MISELFRKNSLVFQVIYRPSHIQNFPNLQRVPKIQKQIDSQNLKNCSFSVFRRVHIYKTSSRVDLIACTLYIVHESSTLMKTQVALHDTGPRYHQRPHNDMKKGTSSLAKYFYVLKSALRRIVNKTRV